MLSRILIPLLILAAGAGSAWWLGQKQEAPTPQHVPRPKLKSEVLELRAGPYQIVLESQGVVRSHDETTLTPLVQGTIINTSPQFEDGAYFEKGSILLELDPADFAASVAAAQSQLARAEAAHAQEEARAKQARLNWDDLGYEEEPSELVLRGPQLKESQANVDSALAQLDQANRNLERTKVRAPFDGRVRRRLVGLGQSVGAATPLGEIFATDIAEVRLPLTPDQLAYIDLPSRPGDPEVPVTLIDALGNLETPNSWQASIVRTEGALDESSRELFAIARIIDPFGLGTGAPPLRIGQPIRASIEGRSLADVFVIPRQALRGVNLVYLITGEEPQILRTEVEPIWSTADLLIVREGLQDGQLISTTRLPYAPNGAPVEILDSPSSAATPGLNEGS